TYEPSVRSFVLRIPRCPFSDAPSTTAPAPSPNRIQVVRSCQFSRRLSASEPTTKALPICPVLIKESATDNALRKPEHAALTSNAKAFLAPSNSARTHREVGKGWPGGEVAVTMGWRSLASLQASRGPGGAERPAMSALPLPSSSTRRCLMPVRTVIHSSLVSTIFSRSWLVITLGGSLDPVPSMTLRRRAPLIHSS